MRAPELFVPLLVACAAVWALWAFARGRRGATMLLVGLLALDLAVWGQSSGWWFSSPKTDGELWREPEPAAIVRAKAGTDPAAYRILTAPHAFDPAVAPVPPSVSHSPEWTLWTQPDVYMMHGVPNAAGYDGFGLARYSRLAGEMKVWGELTDPETTLRGESREIDLLNVRYLVSMRAKGGASKPAAPGAVTAEGGKTSGTTTDASKTTATPTPAPEFPAATEKYGDFMFGAGDLGLPNLGAGRSLRFQIAPTLADRVALLTNLSWSEDVPDGAAVGRVSLKSRDGRVFEFTLRAGADTSEWAHDRADIRSRVRHKRAAVATSYKVADAKGDYEGHTYVTSFALPAPAEIEGGEITPNASAKWPDLLLGVFRVSLVESATGRSYPLRREWLSVERAAAVAAAGANAAGRDVKVSGVEAIKSKQSDGESARDNQSGVQGDADRPRWRLLGQTAREQVYENARALPRAWLAAASRALDEEATLGVIRKGRLPDGSRWEPLRTALVETGVEPASSSGGTSVGSAEVFRYEPNRVDVRTKATAPSTLVLAENHYPGWRAYLDGRRVDMLRVNYAQRGVRVPEGEHEVSFRYRPASFYAGLALSLLAAVALLLWWRRWLPEARLHGLAARLRRRPTLNQGVNG